jgi:hypothetical protein
MKRLIWTALVAATSAACAAIAVRGLRFAWTKILNEPPPAQPWWARKLVAGPLGSTVKTGIEPSAKQ